MIKMFRSFISKDLLSYLAGFEFGDVDQSMVRSMYRLMSSTTTLPTYETLKLSQPKAHVTLVELNRPTKLNAMNKQLFEYAFHRHAFSIHTIDVCLVNCKLVSND